jgi:hypothetical protein
VNRLGAREYYKKFSAGLALEKVLNRPKLDMKLA